MVVYNNAQQRRKLIVALLKKTGDIIPVDHIVTTFGISEATARRDLDTLEKQHLITRTHGGAVIGNLKAEQPVNERAQVNKEAKEEIALHAVKLVPPNSVVFLDAGTTTATLSPYLATIPGVTIITNGLNTLSALANLGTEVKVISVGGTLRSINQALVGPVAETSLKNIQADIAFIGADCVDPVKGISSRTLEQSSLKSLMIQQAKKSYILADSSKIGTDWSNYWLPLESGEELITDSGIDTEILKNFSERASYPVSIAVSNMSNTPE